LAERADERRVQDIWRHRAELLRERLRDPAAALQRERAQMEQLIAAL